MGTHMPHGITQCYLPPDRGDIHALTPVVKVDRRIRWHYTTTILRLRIGARLARYQNCKLHNFARTISRHADDISLYSVPPSAGPLLPLLTPAEAGTRLSDP